MREAPRQRPANAELLVTLAGHVKARPRAVFEAIDARLRPAETSGTLYTADPFAFLIIAQGGWWYRGEYRVVPDQYGSHVEHYILNVAQRAPLLGRLTGRSVLRNAPAEFEKLLRRLRAELE
ncbi:hypothetical protein [Lacisediminihabitans profunda]|uniref:SRPBCC family protein n=1 Tax=Lacisediminihabitans profunda TaxID=2594790 RepID=A0A5C8USY3_9MICO|nr:hypothetical protein [Lacisediminihabitans profunda]TXN31367.1 hypothetical protein FVP33_07350 [Lacisediminihabitans profunda]